MKRTLVAGSVAAGLVACGVGESAGGEWAGTVRDSAGITIVANPETGLWTDADRWRVSEELRIGTAGGDPEYQFGQISGIAELSDGRLAVFDAQAQHLRIFSAEGKHLRTIGGPGSGPGEFGLGAGPVLVGPGDSIYVPDISNQRLNKFTPDAEPVGSSPLELAGGIPLAWQDTPDGLLISQMRQLDLTGEAVDDPRDVILSRGPDGSVLDTLLSFPSGATFQMRDGLPDFTFFSAEPIWTTLTTGEIAYGYNDDYRLGVYEGEDLRRIVAKPFERRPVSERDETLMADAMARVWEEFGVPPEALAALKERIGFAESYPAYALIRGGPEGSVWVQHLRTPSEMDEDERESFNPTQGFGSPDWDVFDPDGRYLGVLGMPERFQPLRIQDDRIFGVWRDELEVQYVLVLRVDWEEAELESGAS